MSAQRCAPAAPRDETGQRWRPQSASAIATLARTVCALRRLVREEEEAVKLIEDAKLLEKAGCFSIVLEKIPAELAAKVTAAVNIPTIGIGAGSDVDGQVLVIHDLIGLTHEFNPRFLRRYLNLYDDMTNAVKE